MGWFRDRAAAIERVCLSEAIRSRSSELSRARLLLWTCIIAGGSCFPVIGLAISSRPDELVANVVVLAGHLLICSSAIFLRWSPRVALPGRLFVVLAVVQSLSASFFTGGPSSPVLCLLPILVLFAAYLVGLRAALWVAVALALGTGAIWLFGGLGYDHLMTQTPVWVAFFVLLWALITAGVVAWLHEREAVRHQRLLETELAERRLAQAELERLDVEKDRFLAYLSHELRNPLTAIVGAAELIKRTGVEPRQQRYVDSLYTAARGMSRMLDDILDLTRAQAGRLQLQMDSVEVEELLVGLECEYAPLLEARGLSWQVSREPGMASFVFADRHRLGQVLRNLLNNALKFTETGGVVFSVAADEATGVRFCVRDTGIGIAEEDREDILEPYRQVQPSRHEGSGLGLLICCSLLAHMNARLEVDSQIGVGSAFTFSLPKAPPPALLSSASLHSSIEGLSVVVAEDNEVAGVVIEGLLASLGCTVTRAKDGLEAISAVTHVGPAVALLDIQMPRLDGLEAARQLRRSMASGEVSTCGLVAITGNLDARDTLRAEGAFDGVLVKPVQRSDLLACLRGYVR